MTTRIGRAAVLLTLLLSAAPAAAESIDGVFLGIGLKSCKTFTDQRAEITNPFTRKALESVYLAWADGFLSGLNARALLASAKGQGPGAVDLSPDKMSRDDRLGVLVNYCLDNPHKNVIQAATLLYNKFRQADAR